MSQPMERKAGSLIIPALRYRDAYAAIDWLCAVLGMTRHAVHAGPNGTVAHAQLTHGGGMLMLGSASNHSAGGRDWISVEETGGRETSALCLVVTEAECEAMYARAKAAVAPIIQEMNRPEYGGVSFTCADPEGHTWNVGSYDPWDDGSADEVSG